MDAEDRRRRLLQLAAGSAFLALAAVLVLIVVNASSGGDGGDVKLEGKAETNRLLQGIPQAGMILGDPRAPVRLIEFGDLQCPVCKAYAEEILPPIIENQVKKGQVRLDFRNLTIIGEESAIAGAAALAAGEQGRGWSYVELFYRNQGAEENSGYAGEDAFLRAVAKGAGVADLARWSQERPKLLGEVERSTAQGHQLRFEGTPSFAIEGPSSDGIETLGTPSSTGDLEAAIEEAG
jgi:protein-disulfide isomerase